MPKPPQRKKAAYSANSIGSSTSPMNSTSAGTWKPTAVSQFSRRRRARPRADAAAGGGRATSGPFRWSGRKVEVIAGYCSSFATLVIDCATCPGDLDPAMSAATLSLTSWPTAGAYAWSR